MADIIAPTTHEVVHDETCGLLMNMHFYRRRIDRLRGTAFRNLEPEDMVEEIAFIESMEREIIMGLCRLDDDGSGDYSLRNYRKEVAKTKISQVKIKEINDALDAYRKAIGKVKVKLRNEYIGHRTALKSDAYQAPEDFLPLVRMATDLMDLLSGKREEYILKGTGAPDIDLRARLGI